ncbi:MAG: RHS repeat-associated core domain-containing protein [Anaerolineales bacterium]|nr:MAG: RHS repeat-associated core domain-containing protein [Anaerolineales bacterium]
MQFHQSDTSWYDIPNAWNAIEIHYQAFANSGSLTLWLDDPSTGSGQALQKQSLIFIDNDTRTVTDVRLGAQGVGTNTRGTVYFDDFESRRFSYIGTLPDPGVNDPQPSNPAGWSTRTYAYSATIPHAVTSVSPETGTPDTYQYDANGNMTCRIENGVVYTHAYNAENRASSIAKRNTDCTGTIVESWSFAYDGDGVRVSTAHFTGTSGTPDSITSYFMGGQYEVKDGATKKYYSIAGMTVAMQDASGLQYLLTDHLDSTVAVTDSTGTLTSQQRYLPFGGVRSIPNSPILSTDFGYTGQRLLDAGMGGIMDYKARFYSPALGRFLQPDSIIPDQSNPQSWNRFAYVLNNPIRYTDPTGHRACGDGEEYDCDGYRNKSAPVPPDGDDGGGDPDWEDVIQPDDDPYIAYTIDGKNYWAHCSTYTYGSNCSTATTFNLSGKQAFLLLLLLENNIHPNSFGAQASKDAILMALAEGLSKHLPGLGNVTQLYNWYEFMDANTLDNAFDTLGSHIYQNMDANGPSNVPSVSITLTTGLHDLRPMTAFENFVTPGSGGRYRGRFAGAVMTVTSVGDPSISTTTYLGEGSGYGDGLSTLLELLKWVSE